MCWIWAGDKCKLCTSPCIKAIGFSLKMRNNNNNNQHWSEEKTMKSMPIVFKPNHYDSLAFQEISILRSKDDANNCRMKKMQNWIEQLKKHSNDKDSINLSTKSNDAQWAQKTLRHCTVLYACACASMHGMHPCDWNMQIYSSKLLSFVCFFFFFLVYLQQTFILLILQAIIYTAGMFCFLHELICAHDTRWFDNRSARKIFIYENDCMREQWTKGKKMQQQKNKSRLFYRLIWLLWRHHKFH